MLAPNRSYNPDSFDKTTLIKIFAMIDGDDILGISNKNSEVVVNDFHLKIRGNNGVGIITGIKSNTTINQGSIIEIVGDNPIGIHLTRRTDDNYFPDDKYKDSHQTVTLNNSTINVSNGTWVINSSGAGFVILDNNSKLISKTLIDARKAKDGDEATSILVNAFEIH